MASNRDSRTRSTTIYIVLSVCVLLAGIGATLWGGADIPGPPDASGKPGQVLQRSPPWFAVGTSLLAAGLASLGFAVVRRFDDIDSVELHDKFDRIEKDILDSRKYLRRARLVIPDASERCLFDPQISGRFKEAVEECSPGIDVTIDVVGLKLNRFLNDQLEYLLNDARRRNVLVRMLLQDPDGEHFRAICRLEARDEQGTKEDILNTLSKLSGARRRDRDLVYEHGNLTILVRFLSQFQPIAFFRVGDTILVRPRIRTSGAGVRFYEEYNRSEGESYFGLYRDHFNSSWTAGEFKIPASLPDRLRSIFRDV